VRGREGLVRVADGRWVQYAERGQVDAPVVVYCHGTPGSRREIEWAAPAIASSGVPMRLIALNRPGYGRSSWVPLEGFLPWAQDVARLADHLELERFAVLGASGGSPFALAIAQELGPRVRRVGIVGGLGPPGLPGMQRSAALSAEWRNPAARKAKYRLLATGYRFGLASWLEGRLLAALGDADRRAISGPAARSTLHEVVREAFGHGGAAAADEAGLFLGQWDVDLDRVTQPVHVWHGGQDTRIPAEVGRELAEILPDASYTLWPEHGHFSWAGSGRIADVAAFLTAADE
jgi:pimeloyl-ACP methyl ester carboxylesterase